MNTDSRLPATLLFVTAVLLGAVGFSDDTPAVEAKKPAGSEPFFETWNEKMIYCSMVVAIDGTVLLFEPVRFEDKPGYTIVKRSEDGGKTWPASRLVRKGPGNYTWLATRRKGTPSEGMIYLAANKDWMARFNLAWILESQKIPYGKKDQ